MMEYHSTIKRNGNFDVCYNLDGPWKHAKWNKPDIGGQILHNPTYRRYLE